MSLPVPVSPVMRTAASTVAASITCSRANRIGKLMAMMPSSAVGGRNPAPSSSKSSEAGFLCNAALMIRKEVGLVQRTLDSFKALPSGAAGIKFFGVGYDNDFGLGKFACLFLQKPECFHALSRQKVWVANNQVEFPII